MNEAILAYKAYHRLQEYLDNEWSWYDNKVREGGWSDLFLEDTADVLCELNDDLEPVLEWLEKKFE